jgi:hydroxymethylglutaryl-CoA lyase
VASNSKKVIKIIECPRDAMQGIHTFIPTKVKIDYINTLLKVGFDTLDCGSFVSAKVIPQLADTAVVLKSINLDSSKTKLLTIVGNLRGAKEASEFEKVSYLGFPFSISETFQKRNINSTVLNSFKRISDIQNCAIQKNKKLVVYMSMAFGNPYNDPWDKDIVMEWCEKLANELEVDIISLSDTIGAADPNSISYLFSNLIPAFPQLEFGAHLHSPPDTWREKLQAAYASGCKRFDGAIKGFGGCPMAKDDLTGNMASENILAFMEEQNEKCGVDNALFQVALKQALTVF